MDINLKSEETSSAGDSTITIVSDTSGIQYQDLKGIIDSFVRKQYLDRTPGEVKFIEEEPTGPTRFVSSIPEFSIWRNFANLQSKFIEQLKDLGKNDQDLITSEFNKVAVHLAKLPFEKYVVELTKSGSIKFALRFNDNLLLIVTKPFIKLEELSANDIIFSVFDNRELIATDVSNIPDFIQKFGRLF
jgi:hypothetical protein